MSAPIAAQPTDPAPTAPATQRTRLKAAQGHTEAVFGKDSALAKLVSDELETAQRFMALGNRGGLLDRVATEVIRLQERGVTLNGSE